MAAGAHEGSVSGNYNYDVFFSFSPQDFDLTNQFYTALVVAGFNIIRDGNLIERSADIKSEVKKLIDRSKIAVIVLSKSYVCSRWCLDQLVMIIEAKRNLILPVFYDVDPSDVRSQTGRIGEAYSRFEDQLKMETDPQIRNELMNKMKEWSKALSFAADVQGFNLPNQDQGDESILINKIIKAVKEKVKSVEEDSTQMEAETSLGELLNQEELSSLGDDWTADEIRLMNIEELPEKPNCPFLVKLLFQQSNDLTEIPESFFESIPLLRVLDLSNTSIKTLPRSIASLRKLRDFFLRGCVLLNELPPEIGELSNLEVFDLEGTELIYLPKEIGKLLKLECLIVSLYRCAHNYIERKGIDTIIPRATLSKFSLLRELIIFVDPDCEWWDAEVEAVIDELPRLRNLKTLKLYFPTLALLQKFLQLPIDVYENLSNFLLTVGRHEQHIISSLPHYLQSGFEKLEKCLIYVNGKENADVIGKTLEHARAFFLDRHWTMEKLFEFKLDEMRQLQFCLVVECNNMNTIVDGDDLYQECNNGSTVLESLRYLSLHYMKNLQTIWRGPFVRHCDWFSRLEILALHTCPELTTLFNLPLLLKLIYLKEVIVESCPKIKNLVGGDLSGVEAYTSFLPSLQKILIIDLPELVSIFGGLLIGPKLESIVFSNCPMLKNLSPMDMYIKYMHEIKGDESEWLNELETTNREIAYLREFGPLTSYNDKLSGNAPFQDQLSFESAKKIILRWDSTVSKVARDQMIFDSDQQEADLYLQAVDEIQRIMQSATIADNQSKANSMIQIAMDRLEDEFRNILIRDTSLTEIDSFVDQCFSSHSTSLTDSSWADLSDDDHTDVDDAMSKDGKLNESATSSYTFTTTSIHELDLMPPEAIYDLQRIAQRMISAGYLRECVQVYGSVRKSAVDLSFRRLGVGKLSITDIQRLEWEVLETKIGRWIRAAKVCVRILFASEKKLCEQIFEGLGTATDYACFMETVKGPAIQLFNFAEAISISRRSSEKLFKILDLHDALSDLMPDIDVVFNSKSPDSIRVQVSEIQSRLAEASRGILSDFQNAVLREPSRIPIPGGTIHPLTRYVMNYVSRISDYKQTLAELILSKPATGSRYSDDSSTPDMDFAEHKEQSTLALHLIWIIVILQFNLEDKSKHYKDAPLAHLFIMNNVHFIVQKIKGSRELREMIGDNYLRKLTGKYSQAATGYERSTWVRVLYCLRDEGLHVSSSSSSGVPRSALRERFKSFNAMFDEVHKTQATWLIPDTQLREELRLSISEKLIPAYRSFLGRFRSHIESGRHPENYIRYSVEDLETAVFDFFEGLPVSQHGRRRSHDQSVTKFTS